VKVKDVPVVGSVYLLPEYTPGFGTGHCFRSLRLLLQLRTETGLEVFVRIPKDFPVVALFPEALPWILEPETFREQLTLENEGEHLFIFDMPKISGQLFEFLQSKGKIVAIDGGGAYRKKVAYLIDTLPNLYKDSNRASPWFLPLPKESQLLGRFKGRPRILISLGGEDKTGLLLKLAENIQFRTWVGHSDVYVLPGPASRIDPALRAHTGSWTFLPPVQNLAEQLGKYTLVITIFGLTAFEALASGTPVLLVHPSRYHKKLSSHSDFADLFDALKYARHITQILPELRNQAEEFCRTRPKDPERRELPSVIEDLANGSSNCCPGCGNRRGKVIARDVQRTFFRCTLCGTEYQMLAVPQPITYTEEYFAADYLRQYGKTYLDDFDTIRLQGKRRLKEIQSLGVTKGAALDIGCAYGPFMAAAKEFGYEVYGIDVSASGIHYIQETLGLDARECSLFDVSPSDFPPLSLVTLWYVIEHFERLEDVLRLLSHLVQPGGILALGTPSSRGVTQRGNKKVFYRQSPLDHYSLWYPRQAKKLLARHGFRVKRIISPSFHPQRYPWPFSTSGLEGFTRLIHRLFQLGDTMEIYAVKRNTFE